MLNIMVNLAVTKTRYTGPGLNPEMKYSTYCTVRTVQYTH